MYRIKNLVLIPFFVLIKCNAQNKETVYLLYDSEIKKNCNYSMFRDGSSPKNIFYKDQKINRNENIMIFEMCNTYFEQLPTSLSTKTITSLKGLNIVDIDYIFSALEKDISNQGNSSMFESIYIIEKISEEKYVQYEVQLIDKYK